MWNEIHWWHQYKKVLFICIILMFLNCEYVCAMYTYVGFWENFWRDYKQFSSHIAYNNICQIFSSYDKRVTISCQKENILHSFLHASFSLLCTIDKYIVCWLMKMMMRMILDWMIFLGWETLEIQEITSF